MFSTNCNPNKHPPKNDIVGVGDKRVEQMLNYKVSLDDEVIVDWSTIQGIVNQSRKFVKHGFDKLRNEHLQKLVSRDLRSIRILHFIGPDRHGACEWQTASRSFGGTTRLGDVWWCKRRN